AGPTSAQDDAVRFLRLAISFAARPRTLEDQMKKLLLLLSFLSCFAFAQKNTPDWVKRSDAYTERVNKAEAQFTPESYQRQGVEGLDDNILELNPGCVERARKATRDTIDWLKKSLATEKDPLVKQDL